MTDLYADLQVKHVAGLLQTWLGSTACKSVLRYPPVFPPPADQFPVLAVFRKGIPELLGQQPCRIYVSDLTVSYCLGARPPDRLDIAWGTLFAVVKTIDEALIRRRHASYEHGALLENLASIHRIGLMAVRYSAELPDGPESTNAFPAIDCDVRVEHSAAYTPSGTADLDRLVIDFNEIQDSDPDHPGEQIRRQPIWTPPPP